MRILYYNMQLGSFDGSSSHAAGMLAALRKACGEGNVMVANRVSEAVYTHAAGKVKSGLGRAIDPLRRARKGLQSRKGSKEAIRRVREEGFEPDVLLARTALYDTAPVEIARQRGCRLVAEVNTPFEYECCDLREIALRGSVRSFERHLYGASDGVYAVSSTLKKMLEERSGLPPEKIKVVPNGYSADLYSDFDNRESVRRKVRAVVGVGDALVVTFVGSLQVWHGIERLVEIADLMRAQGGHRVVFWVLGDGPGRELVRSRAEGADDFFWFGNVDPRRMKGLLYASDLGIMPYERIERFYFSPLKMFDMIGAGLPYIGLRIGQIEEETPRDIAPWALVDSVDPAVYAERIASLAEGDALASGRRSIEAHRPGASWDARAAALAEWMCPLCAD